MALPAGTTAPDFTLTTKTAEGPALWSLHEHVGSSNLVLLFVPMAFTGVCTKELCEISAGLSDYSSLNATVVGISGDRSVCSSCMG